MSGPATLAWHDCRATALVQGENPGSKGHGQPGWKPQRQAQRTSIPPSAGAACGLPHTNGGSAWNANCAHTVMNSRFRAGKYCSDNSISQLIHDLNIRLLLLLLRSLQTAWDRFGRTGMVEVGGVVVLLGTSLLRRPCRKTGNGGNGMCQLEVAGEALAGHHRTELTSANRSCGHRRSWRSWPCDRAQSVAWPWTRGSASSVATMPRSQMAPALTASDFQLCWTWTLCRRGVMAPVRPM